MFRKYKLFFVIITLVIQHSPAFSAKADFYQLKIYHLKNDKQVAATDEYLQNAFLPALHRLGIKNIGIFKPIANDTAALKYIYVLIPFSSQEQWMQLDKKLANDKEYNSISQTFREAPADNAPFERMESVLMEAFTGQQQLLLPPAKSAERVYELRSYESPTQNLFMKKMAMFNADEINIFNRLKFNPVFYGKVISGCHMPNLMYMPIFDNVKQRDEQWKVFGNDPKWKEISANPINENKVSVSHIDSILMHAATYSDY